MSNPSVMGAPLSRKDILILAHLFEISVDYYRTHTSPGVLDFIQALRTLAGLGLTASLADGGYLYPYHTYFDRFARAECGDFRQDPGVSALWGQTLAEMVSLGLDSFRRLGYPGYYSDFRETLEKAIQNIRVDLAHQGDEAKRLLEKLPKKPRRFD
jgi:hypothetical protein